MANAKGLSLRGGRRPTWQSRGGSCDFADGFPVVRPGTARLPRRFAPRNDTSGGYCGAPAPSSGLIPLCKALNERRYRRNRSVRFYRHLVRTGSAFPRLPRPRWGLAMTRQGSAAMGTVRRTASAVLLPLRGRAGHAPPLQGQCGLNGGWYKSAMPSRDCHVASLLAMTRQGSTAMGTVRRTESAVLLPLRGRAWLSPPLQGQCGLNDGRRMIHSSFFILQYSLFLISSIPLRGMANHMTKRPEIPCLSCKFPQSRRICH